MELAGRTALVTGAAGGIGTAIAHRLATSDVRLMLTGRDAAALEHLRSALPGDGHRVVLADLTTRAGVEQLVAEAGPVDLLVNNAGIEVTATFHRLSADELERMVDVNLRAPLLLTHALLPGMLERGRGHVVQVSSIAGLTATACGEPYGATKAGLVRLTESLRATYRDAPVGFSTVCPGFTRGGGMYTRMEAGGHRSNALLGTTTVDRVAAAVVRCVERDQPLALVNGRPLRPLLALGALSPRAAAWLVERTGANGIFRSVAAERESSRKPVL